MVLALTKLEPRALAGARSRWEDSDASAVAKGRLGASLRTAMATAELRELGGCCWRCETTKEERGKRNEGAGRCGRVLVC